MGPKSNALYYTPFRYVFVKNVKPWSIFLTDNNVTFYSLILYNLIKNKLKFETDRMWKDIQEVWIVLQGIANTIWV